MNRFDDVFAWERYSSDMDEKKGLAISTHPSSNHFVTPQSELQMNHGKQTQNQNERLPLRLSLSFCLQYKTLFSLGYMAVSKRHRV